MTIRPTLFFLALLATLVNSSNAEQIQVAGQPGSLSIRLVSPNCVRITLLPLSHQQPFPESPSLVEREYGEPAISLREVEEPVDTQVGSFAVQVRSSPLTVEVSSEDGVLIQQIMFEADGRLRFLKSDQPILGLGEGGPQPAARGDWRQHAVQFDRNGAEHQMIPRWETNAYGSRNPVGLMVGTEGWGLFVSTPWGQVDLRGEQGVFTPWQPPGADEVERDRDRERLLQGRPPLSSLVDGAYDLFVFDAREPTNLMKDVSAIAGAAVMPPKWALGYMQSHRELVDANMGSEELLLWVADTFREKQIPLDAVIYLGTGFTPTGWNTRQPSFDFNPRVFERQPAEVLSDLHARDVQVVVHMVPWHASRLPTLHGDIPPGDDQELDASHIHNYWQEHVDLVRAGVDGWWPDEGDRFNLFERIKRHQLYYQGPLSSQPDKRPWSLHRNGYLGVARWGGWVWSGDTQAAWKTLEAQIAVGLNHSLSLSPYWGSDTGGFYAGVNPPELSGELYARWFQFSAFCPSFRSHGRIWRLRTPFGWGVPEMGSTEGQRYPPDASEMNNPLVEPVCRKYAELRYQLIPYTYSLAAEARDSGMPLMRAMWLHYPNDQTARGIGDQYLWGREMLIAPIYEQGATQREVYLPAGNWYDFWTNERLAGGNSVVKSVDLETMPIYVRAGAIIPTDPIRQFMDQEVDEATKLRVYSGADGQFHWYEDDGRSQAYLAGDFSWTNVNWDDAARQLTIERAVGEKAGDASAAPRKLTVQLLPDGGIREIDYDGRRTLVQF